LRQSLSIPIGKGQIKAEVSSDLKEVILACMEVDESKRISVPELKKFPFFRKSQTNQFFMHTNHKSYGQGSDDRLRPPSYNGEDHKVLKTFGNAFRNEVPTEVNFMSQQAMNRK
jgi:serine/threonine protein kinase